jgi:hypothetical protein
MAITLMTRTMRDFMGLDDVDDGEKDSRASVIFSCRGA